ncbi:MAG: 1,4-alpha-glucan branching enzyme, partial [Myxococcota bacterium]|nr:1,4-alpha-glucan branching enzyme [Myxococcota bacterium]
MVNWDEINAFNAGTATKVYNALGAHPVENGFRFSVWAPNAGAVYIVGDFNDWEVAKDALEPLGHSGIWSIVIPNAQEGQRYKFAIRYRGGSEIFSKADPFAKRQELPPATASVLFQSRFSWSDDEWLSRRKETQSLNAPISIYEVHLGSWRRPNGDAPNYKEIAEELVAHVLRAGFTHVEFL